MKKIIFTLCLICSPILMFSQIAAWDFTGENTVATSTAEIYNSNLDASNLLTRGSGAAASAGVNSFRTQGFQNNGISLTNTDYFQNQFSASPGYFLSLETINARFAGTNSFSVSPGVSMQFAYSLDGTNFTLIGTPTVMTTAGVMPQINVSSISNLQNVPENITVTIRYYASGQTTTGGWGYSSSAPGLYGLSFGGQLNCSSPTVYYPDLDGDTYGDANNQALLCQATAGYVTNNLDCNDNNANINPNTIWYVDTDNDGFGNIAASQIGCTQPLGYVANNTDCNDNDPLVNQLSTWYQDADGDGFGNPTVTLSNCGQPVGYVSNNTDCNDNNPLANQVSTWYADADGDGFGNISVSQSNCGQPSGYVANSTDCNDNSASMNPSLIEIFDGLDNNCNGIIDEGFTPLTFYLDADGDGVGGSSSVVNIVSPGSNYVLITGDCNDANANMYPGNTEICDNLDNNCSGSIDENLVFLNYYQDLDGDNFGNVNQMINACAIPIGYVLNNTDCNDANNMIYPGAVEIAGNGIDEDCNGIDAPLTPVILGIYQFAGTVDCTTQDNVASNSNLDLTFANFSGVGTNCAIGGGIFNRSGWNIGASVDLNQYNEFSVSAANCKSMNLDRIAFKFRPSASAGSPVWHLRSSLDNFATDLDYGTGVNVNNAYLNDTVYITNHTNLTQVTFRFYITEMLGATTTWRMDDVSLYGNVISLTPQTFYADVDQDGFGDLANDTLVCTMPVGFVTNSLDCNDSDSTINPNTIWYMDMDGDLLGNSTMTFPGCTAPSGYVLNATDCNDANANITGPITYYADIDLDGFGDDATAANFCTPQVNMVTVGGDCNDANNTIYPGITYYADLDQDGFGDFLNDSISCAMPIGFVINSQDCNDTDSTINPNTIWYMDMDGDLQGDATNTFTGCTPPTGYVLNSGDCDDTNASITAPITWYADADGDGFGDDASGTLACSQPANTVTIGGDCDDTNNAIYPGATEICDGFDNNCNGTNDEGLIFNTYYLDSDNDQFGAGLGLVSCQTIPIPGYVLVNGDCDDTNPNVYPGATEILDNDMDENCDGVDGYLGLTDETSVQVGLVPNPSNGAFAIHFNSEVANANIQVTDMNGKVLFQQWMNGTSLEVSNLRLSTGAYLVHVTLENQKEILRLIIQ